MEAAEHCAIPDHAVLHFMEGEEPARRTHLRLAETVGAPALTYGRLIALGDFYGTDDLAPVSDAPMRQAQARFSTAYDNLASGDPRVLHRVLQVIDEEVAAVSGALQPVAATPCGVTYADLGLRSARRFALAIPHGRYLRLAETNLDHFGSDASATYLAGHRLAMTKAARLHNLPRWRRRTVLEACYAINAFADHFLTDLFSAGHLRTPRRGLDGLRAGRSVGAMLSWFMHDEDGASGLVVRNSRGDQWTAFGDTRLLDPASADNLRLVRHAVQTSIDEVWDAFLTGRVRSAGEVGALALVPNLHALRHDLAYTNPSPLFVAHGDGGAVMRRAGLNDRSCYAWTARWHPLPTLVRLWSLSRTGTSAGSPTAAAAA